MPWMAWLGVKRIQVCATDGEDSIQKKKAQSFLWAFFNPGYPELLLASARGSGRGLRGLLVALLVVLGLLHGLLLGRGRHSGLGGRSGRGGGGAALSQGQTGSQQRAGEQSDQQLTFHRSTPVF